MTMSSFPWDNKTQSFPWEKQDSSSWQNKGTSSWQSRAEPSNLSSGYQWNQAPPSNNGYHWQSAAPNQTDSNGYPWQGANSMGQINTQGGRSSGSYLGSGNPFDGKKSSFPWEKSAVNSTSKNDLFVFGKGEPKKPGGSYSSLYKEQQAKEQQPASEPAPGPYSSIFNQNKKALFPWEKEKKEGKEEVDPDSLEAQMSEYLKLPSANETEKKNAKEAEKDDNEGIKIQNAVQKKVPAKKGSPKKGSKSGNKKSINDNSEEKKKEKGITEDETPNIEVKVTIANEEVDKEGDPIIKENQVIQKKKDSLSPKSQKSNDEKLPVTSPKTTLSRSSSLTRLAQPKQDRVKSAPAVPRHINKKSEILARSYTSAYAKPKISPKKEEKKDEGKTKPSCRLTELPMSEWVYPDPPEPVDWKTRSDQGLPVSPPKPNPVPQSQSELNLNSTSLREAAFRKWIAKKKENKTFKKADMVTVIKDKEDRPSADEIRQEKFEEWYRIRAVENDKKARELLKDKEVKAKEADEAKELKAKNEAIARRLWEEKDKERKKLIEENRAEAKKKKTEEAKELEEKKKNAEKTFNNWKTNKDPKLKENAIKRRKEELQRKERERDEKEMKEIESQKSFKAWKENKDQEMQKRKAEADRLKHQKEQQEIRKKRKKEEAAARAVQEWTAQKESNSSTLHHPQHNSPWKNGPGKLTTVSRDEMLMANIKHKKNRERHGSARGERSVGQSDNITEIEFVR